ncbi:MAG: sigma-54-dependent Fis family transcriptional regulator [Planctomycetaceae bacterium]|nr:sigma-54-dependent Fis family transcriptional regulator [Planctomycetaceae bacterium]
MTDVMDRDAARVSMDPEQSPVILTPVPSHRQAVLLLSGNRLDPSQLSEALVIGRLLARRLDQFEERKALEARAVRLRSTLELARKFAGETETQKLLERLAEESARLLGSDRASIFIWDQEKHQLVACPALGVPGGKLFIPDNRGIVGEVIQHRKPVLVDDAYSDSRFDQSVDKKSGYRTRNLLAVPLWDAEGNCLGAFELINKLNGDFTDDDILALEDFSIQAATAIVNTQELENLLRSNQQLFELVGREGRIVGESAAMVAQRTTIERLAQTDLPVLILGESGVGKEVAAQALHQQGTRAKQPFIAVNCAALAETLLESELFGHEKGAFTDAQSTHIGKFELAEGGTLFLDEIGDMSLGGQAKLLRVLEQKVITRVGGTQTIPVNVRVIAATNANLPEKVRDKEFRQDLYYRLSVVTLEIPPLRERPEDILSLGKHFLEKFCRDANRKPLPMSPEAEKRLQMHGWPGNVRELRNLMERIAFLCVGDRVEVDDLAFILSPKKDAFDDLSDGIGLTEATNRFQMEYIKRAVKRMGGNMSDAAEFLGLHRSNLYRKMRQLGMEVDDVKP